MRRMRMVLAGAAVALVLPTSLVAQRAVEIGFDGGVAIGLDDPTTTIVSIPGQAIRVGFMAADQISVEPAVGFNWLSGGGSTLTTVDATLGVLYHFTADRAMSQVYVRPFGGVTWIDSDFGSDTAWNAGAGIGVKLPLMGQLGARLEAGYTRDLTNELNTIHGTVGFSLYTQ